MSEKYLTIINHPLGPYRVQVKDDDLLNYSANNQEKVKESDKSIFEECDCYDQYINSLIEIMPHEYYKFEKDANNLCITDLGIEYLAKSISCAHCKAGHCMQFNMQFNKDYYINEAKQLAERIVFNHGKNCPKLKDCDLNILDLEDPKDREARLMKFMLSDNCESSVICEQNQKKPNPMRQAGYFEE